MAKKRPPWLAHVPIDISKLSLDELRAFKSTHEYLTGPIRGPEGLAYHLRGFRYLLFFGANCVAEDRYPALTQCWGELEELFMHDPPLVNDDFVPQWILMDFPCGPKGMTVLDHFEEFIHGYTAGDRLQEFVDAARKSRLGLYQDVLRSKTTSKFCELFTGRVVTTLRAVEEYGQGEIFLVRMIEYRGEECIFHNPVGFPKEKKAEIEGMVSRKLFYFPAPTKLQQYERFMKLAGPYWMSCVTQNPTVDILDPDHYLTYG